MKQERLTIRKKGQVTLPKYFIEKFGLEVGDEDIKAGRVKRYDDVHDAIKWLTVMSPINGLMRIYRWS